jgi:hypothetical protein
VIPGLGEVACLRKKAFFFEKKKQKTFGRAVADLSGKCGDSGRTGFLVL